MNSILKTSILFLLWTLGVIFVLFYPMLVSIYVFLPLFVGVAGYLMVLGIDKNRFFILLITILYALNLEVNLSLPVFMMVISVLLFYAFIYPHLNHFRKCTVCKPLLSVFFIDTIYLLVVLSYDFIFQVQSIALDKILIYSLVVDMLLVVIL